MSKANISVVIRAKNEAAWLSSSLFALKNQSDVNMELILVDNDSTDATLSIAKSFDCKLLSISDADFNYSKALNMGIDVSSSELVAILSAHCIPLYDDCLYLLAKHFRNPFIAGAYGRQLPFKDSACMDKRDLWNTFRKDYLVQKNDYFFHNAFSMIRKSCWMKVPFDQTMNGVEDQAWAKRMQSMGYGIVYDPYACVYHHHGIHHNSDVGRARRVASHMELVGQQ